MQTNIYCNNCGRSGHLFNLCKMPITSIGVIAFRMRDDEPEYLMIRRKDTLGHIDFMRGKYSVFNKHYVINMLNQMTRSEKERMKTGNFDELWQNIWSNEPNISPLYKGEESTSREKFNQIYKGITAANVTYTLNELIDESSLHANWDEPEWGFPKGRRNSHEKDYDCALREFQEETGFEKNVLHNLQNVLPFEEVFTGSNYKSYKHKYYIMFIKNNQVPAYGYQKSEVSKMEWKSFSQCLECIRDYNVEKKQLITKLHNSLTKYKIVY